MKININETFDGLIFINDTTAAKTPVYNFDKKNAINFRKISNFLAFVFS